MFEEACSICVILGIVMWKNDHTFTMKKFLVYCMQDKSAPGLHREVSLFKLL